MSDGMRLDELLAGIAAAPPSPSPGSRSTRARSRRRCLRRAARAARGTGSSTPARPPRAVRARSSGSRGRARAGRGGWASFVAVTGLRDRLGGLADRFYGMPSSRLTVAGVTGTNGKTTCAWLLPRRPGASRGAGRTSARSARVSAAVDGGALTTPDVITLHRQLRTLADAGATHVAMEVSSNALDQRRVDAVRLRVAAFSNLSRDHLDYHGTMERYAEAKARLFRLPGLEHAVINVADPVGARFAAAPRQASSYRGRRRRGGAGGARFVHVGRVAADRGLELESAATPASGARSPLIGAFNAETSPSRSACSLAWQFDVDAALAALAACGAPPGRMEGHRLPNGALAVVDYAHTPGRARQGTRRRARARARPRARRVRLRRRPRSRQARAMGEAAERLADRVIVTDDNPRGEDADRIVAMILEGMREPRRRSSSATARSRSTPRSPRRGPATRCWSPARATRTTRSSAANGARSATARPARARGVRLKGGCRGRRVAGGRLAGADAAFAGVRPTRARSRRAAFRGAAGERFDGNASSRPRRRAGPRAPWSSRPAAGACRRSSSTIPRRR